MRSVVLLLPLAVLTPAPTLAQDAAPPSTDRSEPTPSDALTTPEGYRQYEREPVTPQPAAPERAADAPERAAGFAVLPFGAGPLDLHVRSGRGGRGGAFYRLCTAPCRANLAPGAYTFGVSPRDHGPRQADGQPVNLLGEGDTIVIHYDHRGGLRAVGWTFFTIGAMAMALSSIPLATSGNLTIPLVIGLPIFSIMMVPFFSMAFLMDASRVEVVSQPR